MPNRKYLPSLGFVVLLLTLLVSFFFVKWVLGPLSFERAHDFEQKGHALYRRKAHLEASESFLDAANASDDSVVIGRMYRYAAVNMMALGKPSDAVAYFKLALKYNEKDEVSERELRKIEGVNEQH